MADWETSTSNDGGAAAASFAEASGSGDTAAHTTADATADALDMTPLAGTLTEVEVAAFRERAQEAGWVATQPVDYSVRQSSRDDETAHYLANSAVYEWNDEFGDVGPEIPELEEQLFGGHFRVRQGEHMKNLQFEVTVEGPDRLQPARSFATAGLHPILQDIVTNKMGYNIPTPIQAYTIPAVLSGADVTGISQTGSGKTAAYMIPVISRLCGKAKKICAARPNQAAPDYNPRIHRVKAEPVVVIVVPTHELAIQVFDECRRLCYRSMLRPFATYGGQPFSITVDELAKGCDILVATPGRLCDLMRKPDILTMSRVLYTIIDEADEMLNMDWEEELRMIMAGGDTNDDADHVYLMFSATFSREMRALARQYMAQGEDYRLTVGRAGSSHKNIQQDVIFVDGRRKLEACYDLIYAGEPGRTLIFCNSKRSVDELDAYLYNRELPSTSIHSDRNQREREDSMRAFKTGNAPILITTGVTARGLDVASIRHVINYDLPSAMHGGITEYVHRIGRTARIGNTGKATSFYDERRDEEMGPALVNILLESSCPVPDFLEHLIPEGGVATFDDDKSDDEEAEAEQGGAGFGGADAGTDAAAGGFAASSAWGAAPAADDSFAASGPAVNSSW